MIQELKQLWQECMKYLSKFFYWIASRLDKRFPRYPDAIKEDMMIYGNGFAKRIKPEEMFMDFISKK